MAEINYWLFQSNPQFFRLSDALRDEELTTYLIKAHKDKIKVGDKAIIWQTGKEAGCLALVTISSQPLDIPFPLAQLAYFLSEAPLGLKAQLQLDYNLWNRPVTQDLLPQTKEFDRFYAGLPGTNYKATPKQYKILEDIVKEMDVVHEPTEMYLPRKSKAHPLNTILYGPPGTGKTYTAITFALSIIENRSLEELGLEERSVLRQRFENYLEVGQVGFVTFHQSFSYEDFVEGIKPETREDRVVYELENGVFKEIANRAGEESNKAFVLIIDEINRGNIAGIFGELITLLETDKRQGASEALSVQLPYSKQKFTIPANLYLVATMNTADRSIEALDIALRRRFFFVEMLPEPEIIRELAQQPFVAGIDLVRLLTVINQRIEVLIGKDYCIGHTYFLQLNTLADLKSLFLSKIIPLLQEYFFGDYGKIGLVLGKAFVREVKRPSNNLFADFNHDFAGELADKRIYELATLQELQEADFVRIYQMDYQ